MPTTTINLSASDGGNGSSDGGKLVKFKSTGALEGRCTTTFGVKGTTTSGNGVEGRTETGSGVYGLATGNGSGVNAAAGGTGAAVNASNTSTGNLFYGSNGSADIFQIKNNGELDWSSATAKTATITNLGLGALSLLNSVDTAEIADNAVTFAKIQDINTSRLLGRTTAGTGSVEEVTVDGGLEFNGSAIRRSALTGDVTASAGSGSTTIANDAVTNAKLANMATQTIKGRNTAGTGDPEDLTAAQVRSLLSLGDMAQQNASNVEILGGVISGITDLAVADGGTGASTASGARTNLGVAIDQIDFFIPVPINGTVTLRLNAKYAFTVDNLSIKTTSGTITAALQIDGTPVTSISAVSVTSTEQTVTATGANSAVAGTTLDLVFTSNASAANLSGSVQITRA